MVNMGVLVVRLRSDRTAPRAEMGWGEYALHEHFDTEVFRSSITTFQVIDGDPLRPALCEFNAKQMVEEWVKHTYHNGFTLPDMPAE